MKTSKTFTPSRRQFLRDLATTAPAVAVAAAVPARVAAAPEPAAGDPRAQAKGYQLTQHVIDYYKSAAL